VFQTGLWSESVFLHTREAGSPACQLSVIKRPEIQERIGMSTSAKSDGPSETAQSVALTTNPRRVKTGGRVVIMLVLCGVAAFLIWRSVWDSRHPALAAARGLHSATPTQRLAAISELSEQASPESAEAIGPLAAALKDPDAGVRAAAAQAVGLIGSYSARSAPHADLIRDAVSRLLESLKDPEP